MPTLALEHAVTDLVDSVMVLASDVKAAAKLSEVIGDTQFARRAYVRAVFALVEGNMNLMASVILSAEQRGEIQVSVDENEILRQERAIEKQGEMITRPKFIPTKDRLGLLMEIFARLYGQKYQLDKSIALGSRSLRVP